MEWTYELARKHLEEGYRKGKKDGLRGMAAMMEKLNHPQKDLRFVHVTGTNGKGSTCVMVASVLQAAGYRVGLYLSPFVDDFRERMQIDRALIPPQEFAEIYGEVAQAAEELEQEGHPYPSEFEILTCCGLLYFKKNRCDIVVLEVGIGGANDATNIVEQTEVAVFTPISLDHMAMLGDTTAAIAKEKSGILKPNCTAVTCWGQDASARAVLQSECEANNIPLIEAQRPQNAVTTAFESTILWDGQELIIPLSGEYQVQNACLALTVLCELRARGWIIPTQAVADGMKAVRFNARIECISQEPLVILDGSHNPAGVDTLVQYIKTQLTGQRVTLVLGMFADKTHRLCIEKLALAAQSVAAVAIDYYRALPAQEVAAEAEKSCPDVHAFERVEDGMIWALEHAQGPIIVCGSLYLPGEARTIFERWKKDFGR